MPAPSAEAQGCGTAEKFVPLVESAPEKAAVCATGRAGFDGSEGGIRIPDIEIAVLRFCAEIQALSCHGGGQRHQSYPSTKAPRRPRRGESCCSGFGCQIGEADAGRWAKIRHETAAEGIRTAGRTMSPARHLAWFTRQVCGITIAKRRPFPSMARSKRPPRLRSMVCLSSRDPNPVPSALGTSEGADRSRHVTCIPSAAICP